MKIQFTNGNFAHVDRSVGEALILGGMATLAEPDADAPKCELTWTLGSSSHDGSVSVIRYTCAACKISGAALGIDGARQLVAKPIFHRGVKSAPPADLVQGAYGRAGSAFAASMITMHRDYAGSTKPYEYTDTDADLAAQGKTPPDPTPHTKAVLLGNVNEV